MQLVVDQFETMAGVVLQPVKGGLSDEQFFELCERYPDERIETTAEGDVIIMPPTHPRTGQRNAAINFQLFAWAEEDATGEAFDSSCGFFLPNGGRRSPDSAWIPRERLQELQDDDKALWHVTPDFIIELKSASDRMPVLRDKMREWVANGVSLAWLIHPDERTAEIFRANGSCELLREPAQASGEDRTAGFTLKMGRIWQGLRK